MKDIDNRSIVRAPFNEKLPAEERAQIVNDISELVKRIVMHVICYTLVNYQELLKNERLAVAHAFLQRATSTHLCNHKLTTEGLVYEYKGEPFQLHEEYRTMTLTRSVYEYLAMFYFLFEHPRDAEQREVVWKYWLINSRKNLLDSAAKGNVRAMKEQKKIYAEIEQMRHDIASTAIGRQCWQKLDLWTKPESAGSSGSLEFVEKQERTDVRKVSYSQAWRFLYHDKDMTLFYNYLSMHCHPVYDGLMQYLEQTDDDNNEEVGMPLYFSCCFLAHLCRLFLKQIPYGQDMITQEFSWQEQQLFSTLSRLR